jgi:uncharacterized protein GlcG (DUF336 family)
LLTNFFMTKNNISRGSYMKNSIIKAVIAGVFLTSVSVSAFAGDDSRSGRNGCASLPNYATLKGALIKAVADEGSGLDLQMWATIVDRDGVVCAVAFSGNDRGSQWPGSRVISAQKANTANAFSLDGLALSTANLYSAAQGTSQATPLGGSLYGLQFSNPVDTEKAYKNPNSYGTQWDSMVGNRVGGVNVFGGGLGLYNKSKKVVGGVGVSGDTSCADHNIGWRLRANLGLDNLAGVGGVAALFNGDAAHPDNMLIDGVNVTGANANGITDGFEQPSCLNTANPETLPAVK